MIRREESKVKTAQVKLNLEMSGSDTPQEKKISFLEVSVLPSIQMNQLPLLENPDVVKVLLSTCL